MKNQTKSIAENLKMNLIEKLGLEKCKQIIEGAPDWAVSVNLHNGMYYDLREVRVSRGNLWLRGDLWLMDLRTAIANHERTDTCSDIANHLSPLTKVIDK